MKRHLVISAIVAFVAGVLFVATAGSAGAQTITADPIATVPGYKPCLGNQQSQDVTSTITCANQRTFHFGAASRTVVAVSTVNPDGTASVTYTLTGGVAPADIPLVVRAHTGISSGPTISETTGVILKGSAGPVTLGPFAYDCGQMDVKAVFVAPGNTNGRISGGFFCREIVVTTTTTAPATTVAGATTLPGQTTVTPSTALSASAAQGPLPATGRGVSAPVAAAGMLISAGLSLLAVAWYVRRRPAN
jgi:hypothetical protein